jgi:tight adherence protein B
MLLLTAFLFMLIMIFVIMAVFAAPTAEQKAFTNRLAAIRRTSYDGSASVGGEGLLKPLAEGHFGWLEDMFENFSFTERLRLLLLQSDSKSNFGTLVVTSFGLAVAACFFTYLFLPMLVVAMLAAGVAAYSPFLVLEIKRKRKIAAFNQHLPDSIDMIARSLRAGHSMIAAINIVAEHAVDPVGPEFAEVFRKQNFGLPIRDALMELLERIPSQDMRVLATAILVQKDTGGNLAEILDRTVKVIRERLRIQGEIRTHTAQGRMTGWILCALPVVMLVLINMVNPGYSDVLFHDPFGRELLYVGIVLLLIGGFLIRAIVNGIEV